LPNTKIELASDVLAQRWGAAARLPAFRPRADSYPLSLISPASDGRASRRPCSAPAEQRTTCRSC
jgi:hypothetical protein